MPTTTLRWQEINKYIVHEFLWGCPACIPREIQTYVFFMITIIPRDWIWFERLAGDICGFGWSIASKSPFFAVSALCWVDLHNRVVICYTIIHGIRQSSTHGSVLLKSKATAKFVNWNATRTLGVKQFNGRSAIYQWKSDSRLRALVECPNGFEIIWRRRIGEVTRSTPYYSKTFSWDEIETLQPSEVPEMVKPVPFEDKLPCSCRHRWAFTQGVKKTWHQNTETPALQCPTDQIPVGYHHRLWWSMPCVDVHSQSQILSHRVAPFKQAQCEGIQNTATTLSGKFGWSTACPAQWVPLIWYYGTADNRSVDIATWSKAL